MDDPIKRFANAFAQLPSIGPRQAMRLAFHIAALGKNTIRELSDALLNLEQLARCPNCFRTHTGTTLCEICSDTQRQNGIIAIIEKETELLSLERAKKFFGTYLVIGDIAKSSNLTAEQKLRLASLKERIRKEQKGSAEEIILAISPTAYGDFAAAALTKELTGAAKKITRLGRGIPTGGEIEFADEDTLANALTNRS